MRGILLFTAFLFIAQNSVAQLSIKPSGNGKQDHYLFVKEDLLYVSKDLKLTRNLIPGSEASIYLRKGAQLVQGPNQQVKNSGNGQISLFAEGTTNAFDYNYWSAPVSAPENDLFGISLLHSPASAIKSTPAKQTTALNGLANPLTISTRWIYTFNGNGYYNWNFVGGSTAIAPGYGFIMKGTEGVDATVVDEQQNNSGNAQRYDFRGRANSGNIEIPVKSGDFVLVGNPYPSSLDLSLFLLENSGEGSLKTACYEDISRNGVTTGIAYFWDSRENGSSHYLEDYVGGYGAYSPVDPCTTGVYESPVFRKVLSGEEDGSKGKNFSPRVLPIGRGFMVQSLNDGKIVFRNRQRQFGSKTGHPEKQRETNHKKHFPGTEKIVLPKLKLAFTVEDHYERQLTIAFWDEATTEIDPGMDAEAFEIATTDAGFYHEEKSFVIDVRPQDISQEIPIFLQVQEPYLKMSFSRAHSENLDFDNLYILDTETNEYFSIKEEAFTVELQPGNYHGRFRLAFAEKIPQEELPQVFFEEDAIPPKFDIIQNNYLGELEIIGNDHSPVKAVGIFDLQGKRLLYRTGFDNRRSISITTGNWANAVYIVKVTGMDNKKTTKKISVYNR
ncbi:T9SS type A sorting domain-containing protein [Salinimicrobium oceani]|uniref:T9SS type A sorting domain-containing protein n=1 Tax=Salinimicrobium oceani TaxID=2722702 RepID=A0ABX1D370_9FLAO|nr:T9SS type A sorting domain-containing protein [Salinimicrobium oceani]NJW54119.1 T9SS type A sorting domain-containing protein [Salinimicrobium oceani]